VLRIYTCAHADEHGWRGCRGTDLLRGRPGSCPTLSRYTIIFLVVCALVSPRERYRPPSFFLSPVRPPFCLLIGVTAVYFVLLLSVSSALRELDAVGVPSSPFAPSPICLPTRCTVSRFSSCLTGSFIEMRFYSNKCT